MTSYAFTNRPPANYDPDTDFEPPDNLYPNISNRQAVAGLRALGFQAADVQQPRTAVDTWQADVLKWRRLLAWAVRYQPSVARKWTALLAEAIWQAAIEADRERR